MALARGLGPGGRLIGLDRDPEMLALAGAATAGLPVTLVRASYSELGEVLENLKIDAIDGIVSIWVCRRTNSPGASGGSASPPTAPSTCGSIPMRRPVPPTLVNSGKEEDLARIFFEYGEERYSRRVARRIVEARRAGPIATTGRLADLVRRSIPGKWGPIDPATRVFQALRIAVNEELEHLESALEPTLADWLRPGGRAAFISFHSLEDRRVKVAFRDDPRMVVLTRKPVVATAEEAGRQPPSAKREIEGRRAMSESGWATVAAEPPISGSGE